MGTQLLLNFLSEAQTQLILNLNTKHNSRITHKHIHKTTTRFPKAQPVNNDCLVNYDTRNSNALIFLANQNHTTQNISDFTFKCDRAISQWWVTSSEQSANGGSLILWMSNQSLTMN